MLKCEICGKEFSRFCSFSLHLNRFHKEYSQESYYKKFIDPSIHYCKNCGKELSFKKLSHPYSDFCSKNCGAHSSFSRRKAEETMLKRYGHKHALQNEDIHKKQKETVEEKYGSTNIFSSKIFIEQMKNFNKEKYGVENYYASEDFKEKSKKTKLERYGRENYVNVEKVKETKLKKYNDKNWNNPEKMIESKKKTIFLKYKKFENQHFKLNSIDDRIHCTCQCLKCGREFSLQRQLFFDRARANIEMCTFCNPLSYGGTSYEEKDLCSFLTKDCYLKNIMKNDRTILDGRELDIYIPEKKLAIEFDGLYWHCEVNKENNYHFIKTEECERKGIQLIHIFEDEWKYKQEIVKSRLRGLLGLNERVFARKCVCKQISYDESKNFLDKNHIQGNCVSKYRYGLFYNNELVSVMTFGESRFKKGEFELLRFANKLNTNVIGGASRIFKHFLREHQEIKEIISFADRRWSKGNLYEKLGFMEVEKTKPNYFYIIDGVCENRINFQKHKLVAEGADPNKTEHQIMLEKGYYRIYDCGNMKFRFKVD